MRKISIQKAGQLKMSLLQFIERKLKMTEFLLPMSIGGSSKLLRNFIKYQTNLGR